MHEVDTNPPTGNRETTIRRAGFPARAVLLMSTIFGSIQVDIHSRFDRFLCFPRVPGDDLEGSKWSNPAYPRDG